jgi:hypothetical protein
VNKRLLIALLVVLPVVRIMSTYTIFSQTTDETFHIASGFQWLTTRECNLDQEHPPLARIAMAVDAVVTGARAEGYPEKVGNEILERNGRYRRNLFGARAGNLPFFLLALIIVGLWTRDLFGDAAALVAMALFGALPPILAHAGLATTDMAAAATTVAALYFFDRWLESPTWPRASFAALAIGAGVLAKFSFLLFFPMGALALLARYVGAHSVPADRNPGLKPHGLRIAHLGAMMIIVFALVWGGYKFSVGSLIDARLRTFLPGMAPKYATEYARAVGYDWVPVDVLEAYYRNVDDASRRGKNRIDFVDWMKAAGSPLPLPNALPPSRTARDRFLVPLRTAWAYISLCRWMPAPDFVVGVEVVRRHSSLGHDAFLFGRFSRFGWWYYFPVILFFKSPLAFVVLTIAGIVLMIRTHRPEVIGVALAPLAMLVPAMISSINIGVRHVLPLYPLLTIAAAFAVVRMWARWRVVAALLLAWYFIATGFAHPDYLSYFNEAAGRHPERIAVDSNLDWGQDLLRLSDAVRNEHIDHLHLAYFGTANWQKFVPEAEELPPFARVHGWVAISEDELVFGKKNRRDAFAWLRAYQPVRRIGKSIRLYWIP